MSSRPRRRIVLHAGLHKTGTTSAQTWLARRAPELARQGLLYPRSGRGRGSPAHHYLTFYERFPSRGRPGRLDMRAWTSLLAEVEAQDLPWTLVSSETLWRIDLGAMRQIRDHLADFEVHVVAFLRHPRTWIPSWYRQEVRTGRCHVDLRRWVARYPFTLRPGPILEDWEQVVGPGFVHLASYEEACRRGGTEGAILDLLERLGLSVDRCAIPPLSRPRNRTPDDDRIRAHHWIHTALPRALCGVAAGLLRRLPPGPLPGWVRELGRGVLPDPLVSADDLRWVDAQFTCSYEDFCRRRGLDPRRPGREATLTSAAPPAS